MDRRPSNVCLEGDSPLSSIWCCLRLMYLIRNGKKNLLEHLGHRLAPEMKAQDITRPCSHVSQAWKSIVLWLRCLPAILHDFSTPEIQLCWVEPVEFYYWVRLSFSVFKKNKWLRKNEHMKILSEHILKHCFLIKTLAKVCLLIASQLMIQIGETKAHIKWQNWSFFHSDFYPTSCFLAIKCRQTQDIF